MMQPLAGRPKSRNMDGEKKEKHSKRVQAAAAGFDLAGAAALVVWVLEDSSPGWETPPPEPPTDFSVLPMTLPMKG